MSTVTSGQVTVTNSDTQVVAVGATRRSLVLVNMQTTPVYIGPTGVATTTGFRLDPGASLSLYASAAVYGTTSAAYTASGDAMVQYVEETSA